MWKCFDPELERQIRCFPYGERSDVPRLQQVEQKAIGRQRNLGLHSEYHTDSYHCNFVVTQKVSRRTLVVVMLQVNVT